MQIVINLDSPEPVFAQIVDQIKTAVIAGTLHPGDGLPAIRQLANDLDVNSKTVAKAYRLLERDSVVQTRGYRGTFVHPDASSNAKVDLGPIVQSRLSAVVRALRAAGATDSEIRIAFRDAMKS